MAYKNRKEVARGGSAGARAVVEKSNWVVARRKKLWLVTPTEKEVADLCEAIQGEANTPRRNAKTNYSR